MVGGVRYVNVLLMTNGYDRTGQPDTDHRRQQEYESNNAPDLTLQTVPRVHLDDEWRSQVLRNPRHHEPWKPSVAR